MKHLMYSLLSGIFLLSMFPATAEAKKPLQEDAPKRTTMISLEVSISASKEAVWHMIADYANPHLYTKTVVDTHLLSSQATGEGATRHCELPGKEGKNYVEEKITEWDEGVGYTYLITNTNAPIKYGKLKWSVIESGAQTLLHVDLEYKTKYGFFGSIMNALMIKRALRKGLKKGLTNFKSHIETKQNANTSL